VTYLAITDTDPELFDPSILPKNVLEAVEADSFWCLSRLLDGIQDNYIFAQPGIQRSVRRMAELVARIDGLLYPLAQYNTSTDLQKKNSSSFVSSRITECRIHAVCFSLDELLADAGDQRPEYNPDVGYLFGQCF